MEKKETNTGLIITIVVLVMLLLFGGVLFTLSSMGYLNFDNNTNAEEKNNNEETDKDIDITDDGNNDVDEDNNTVLTETEALDIAKDLTSKYFEYYHNLGPYCGGYDNKDYLSFGSYETGDFRDYYASTKFKNINELTEYFSSFMIESLYPNYLTSETSYLEQDGKLYCQLSHKGCGDTYNDSLSTYTIQKISANLIAVDVTLASDTCGTEANIRKGTVAITKDSTNNWLISKYEVVLS